MQRFEENGTKQLQSLDALCKRVVRPEAIELVPNAYRLKVFEYVYDVGCKNDTWLLSTIELFDRFVGRPAQTYNSNLEQRDKDIALACTFLALKMSQADLEERDAVAILEEIDAEAIRDKILKMNGAKDDEKRQQWARIQEMEVAICKAVSCRFASPSLLDFALELCDDVHELATQNSAEIAAEVQFQGWESATVESTESRTCHVLVTGMLIELALMHLPETLYKINAVAVGVITACLALQRFPSNPMTHVLQEHLTRIGLQFIADSERGLCETFQEKLLEVWRRSGPLCAVMQKWMGRAKKNEFVALIVPPAVKDALQAVASPAIKEPSTPLQGKRILGKRILGKTSFASVALPDELSPKKSRKGAGQPAGPKYYVPVAKKRSGGSRAGAGRKRQAQQ